MLVDVFGVYVVCIQFGEQLGVFVGWQVDDVGGEIFVDEQCFVFVFWVGVYDWMDYFVYFGELGGVQGWLLVVFEVWFVVVGGIGMCCCVFFDGFVQGFWQVVLGFVYVGEQSIVVFFWQFLGMQY